MVDRPHIERAGLREALEKIPAAVTIVEAPSARITFANTRAWRMMGGASTEALDGPADATAQPEYLGDLYDGGFEMLHLNGRPYEKEEWPLFRSIERGEEVEGEEVTGVLPDGTRYESLVNSSPIRDEEGNVVAAVAVFHDVTGQRHAAYQRQKLAEIVENSTDFIGICDLDWRAVYVNEAGRRLVGLDSGEEVGKKGILDFFAPGDRGFARDTISRRVEEEGRWAGELCLRNFSTGEEIPVSWDGFRIDDPDTGEPIALATIIRDITGRRRFEEEIESQSRQQAAVADLGQRALGRQASSGEGLQALLNEAADLVARTLGVEYGEVVETLPGKADDGGEELLLRAGSGFAEGVAGATLRAGRESQAGYALLVGEPVVVEDLAEERRFDAPAVLSEHGVVSGASVIMHGRRGQLGLVGAYATSRREFTDDDVYFMQAVANVLAAAIEREKAGERLSEVRQTERARLARDLHDEALQELSHAIAQAQRLEDAPDPEQARLLQTLGRMGEHLRGAIHDLRLGSDGEKSLPEMLEAMVERHRAGSPEREIRLDMPEAGLPELPAETGREVLRIVGEAMTNACRHSGAARISVSLTSAGGTLRVEVSDDGAGFSPGRTRSTGIRGMRERAGALGARLEIHSQPGWGTRVSLDLAPNGRPGYGPPEADRGDTAAVRILLVEDHAAVREALASSFEREEDFEISAQAASLAEARRVLETQPIDVAVVDLGLPDGYGGDLIRQMRDSNPQAQALVLSANLDRAGMARAVDSGAAGILDKTAHLAEVVGYVRRLRAGETILPPEEAAELPRPAERREGEQEARRAIQSLTPREREILRGLAEGLSSEGIAERLRISVRTERNHAASILAKLGVHSRLAALVFALRHGVVEIGGEE